MTENAPSGLAATVHFLDRISLWSGKIVGWLIIPMVLSLVWEVVARYFFNAPTIWAYDMTYMFYGSFFMLGAAYTLMRGGHIRTDSLYGQWSVQRQGLVDAICYLVAFFPPLIALLYVTWDYFWISFNRGERVVSSPWMPVIYPLKLVTTVPRHPAAAGRSARLSLPRGAHHSHDLRRCDRHRRLLRDTARRHGGAEHEEERL